ncbi:MAG: carboxypeptidase-like regulatory domain-containing protein [Bacteroidales bacterium]|nr:carboxypeptidase-like regulatory domain-containing protein [Bacteroidales bacterium]
MSTSLKTLAGRIIILLAAFTLPIQAAYAQESAPEQVQDSLRYSVSGKVKDAKSGSSLQFVNVVVPGRHYTTVTNADGEFTIKSDIPITDLNFSLLGYKTVNLPVSGSAIKVAMEPDAIRLAPAVVVAGEPRTLVRDAMERIQDNYMDQDELLKCFYRETIQKRQRYIYVSEAVSRIFKTSYSHGIYKDASALEKSRVLLSQRKSDTLSVKFLGGPSQAVDFDVVKNPEILLSNEELNLYAMQMGTPVMINDRMNYTVKISPASQVEYPLYYGTLFIDAESHAFTRIELSLDTRDEQKATRSVLVSKPVGLRFHPREMSVVIDYRLEGTRWRLNYFRSIIRFACDWRKRLLSTNYTSVNELIVTDKYPEAVPIVRKEQFRHRDALSEKAAFFADPDFWKDYNIIEPSTSLEHAVDKLLKR